MSAALAQWASVQRFLSKESLALDEKDWDAWLAMYSEDAEYWVPAWDSDGKLTDDPTKQLSLIYYSNRGGLEDRVFRFRTERSAASKPLTRTCHIFDVLEVVEQDYAVRVRTNWMVHSVRENRVTSFFGSAHYMLEPDQDSWIIKAKKTAVMNDVIPDILDFYMI